jgi:TRAP-type C4-dicarboxylate transport system substrate-binding protein
MKRLRVARSGVRTLIFANAYARSESAPEIAAFLENVERLAEGRLRLELISGWTSPRERDGERTVLEDLARGVADLAWAGARSVGAAFGIRSLDPLHAPLLFPNEEAVRRFLTVAELDPLLAPLREVGIAGLALLPGGMRRPFGITAPLVGPDDWSGKVIRTHGSLPAIASFRALGATPVLRAPAEEGGRRAVGIDGMDLHPRAVAAWGYAGWLTWNVPLWPRIILVAGNARRLERLSSGERAVLEEAARLATAQTAERLPRENTDRLRDSVSLVEASEDDLSLLYQRLRPVHDELRSTREGDKTLANIERLLALPNDPS